MDDNLPREFCVDEEVDEAPHESRSVWPLVFLLCFFWTVLVLAIAVGSAAAKHWWVCRAG